MYCSVSYRSRAIESSASLAGCGLDGVQRRGSDKPRPRVGRDTAVSIRDRQPRRSAHSEYRARPVPWGASRPAGPTRQAQAGLDEVTDRAREQRELDPFGGCHFTEPPGLLDLWHISIMVKVGRASSPAARATSGWLLSHRPVGRKIVESAQVIVINPCGARPVQVDFRWCPAGPLHRTFTHSSYVNTWSRTGFTKGERTASRFGANLAPNPLRWTPAARSALAK